MARMREIAEWVGAEVAGGDGDLRRVSAVEYAGPDSVVFAIDKANFDNCLASNAGAILASLTLHGAEGSDDPRVLWVKDARFAFALVARRLAGGEWVGSRDATAVVASSAVVGEGTTIGAGVVIGSDVRIGNGCNILARVVIYPGTVLGDRVVVQSGAVLGSTGFGYARNPETGEYVLFPQQGVLIVEDDVEIGANTTIDRGALGETRIGRGTKIDNLVHIGHNCLIGKNVIIAAQTGISGSSVVEDGAILGGQVGIGEHATVGAGVILGGGAGVLSGKKMRGAGEVFWGRPARPLKEYLRDLARLRRGKNE